MMEGSIAGKRQLCRSTRPATVTRRSAATGFRPRGRQSSFRPACGVFREFFEDVPPETPNLEAVRGRVIEVLVDYLQTLQTERHAALR